MLFYIYIFFFYEVGIDLQRTVVNNEYQDDTLYQEGSNSAKTFECEVCHKMCSTAAALGSHRRVHQ